MTEVRQPAKSSRRLALSPRPVNAGGDAADRVGQELAGISGWQRRGRLDEPARPADCAQHALVRPPRFQAGGRLEAPSTAVAEDHGAASGSVWINGHNLGPYRNTESGRRKCMSRNAGSTTAPIRWWSSTQKGRRHAGGAASAGDVGDDEVTPVSARHGSSERSRTRLNVCLVAHRRRSAVQTLRLLRNYSPKTNRRCRVVKIS